MYAQYRRQRADGKDHFKFVQSACLFGCNEGFIPWLLRRQVPEAQSEPFKWHVDILFALCGNLNTVAQRWSLI